MKILLGYAPDTRGDDALALAALLARTADAQLVVANVHAPAWPARGPGSVDAEWVAYLRDEAKAALVQARQKLSRRVPKKDLEYVVGTHKGSGRGLVEIAKEHEADLIVIGSAPRGRPGRIAIGSTADQLLHGSPVPVMLAPRGYAENPPRKLQRLSIAYWRRRDAAATLAVAAGVAERLGIPVHLVTLVINARGLTKRFRNEEEIVRRHSEQAEADLAEAAAGLDGDVTTEVLTGSNVTKALSSGDWRAGELIACMSSEGGPLRKVFLGDTSGKIVRASAAPVVILPRASSRP